MTIRIAHLSDIHFGDENVPALEAATAWLQEAALDLLVVSGDLTRWGEPYEFEAAATWLAGISTPKLVTPGNHDAPYLAWAQRLFVPFRRFERWVGPAPAQTFVGGDLAVYGVNTARGAQPRLNWSKGQISSAQTAAATRWLAAAPRRALRVVVCHHPLVEMVGGPMTGRVWGGAAAAAAFAASGVDLILSGHVHAAFASPMPHGDGETYAVGAGTLSLRERGTPPTFNLIEAEDGVIRIKSLGWSGSQFTPQRTWALQRRAVPASPAGPGADA